MKFLFIFPVDFFFLNKNGSCIFMKKKEKFKRIGKVIRLLIFLKFKYYFKYLRTHHELMNFKKKKLEELLTFAFKLFTLL